MKQSVSALLAVLLVSLLLASAAFAHGGHSHEETTTTTTLAQETTAMGALAPSGGPNIFLPAVALLLGGGVLGYAILRRA